MRAPRESMGDVNIPYYVTRQRPGRPRWGYWAPCLARRSKKTGKIEPTLMAQLGFALVDCGPDGPHAWGIAKLQNDRWEAARAAHARGELVPRPKAIERVYPPGAIGEGFARYRQTATWKKKKPRTREDWKRGFKHIDPIFGDVDAKTVALEHLDAWYAALLDTVGVREAHRAMKIWRALWRVIATMRTPAGDKYCERDADPSLGIRRETPTPRSATWLFAEAERIVKRAFRMNYAGLGTALAVAWDSQLSPIDLFSLSPAKLAADAQGMLFEIERGKTDRRAIATVTPRVARIFRRYVARLPFELHPQTPFFHTRGGAPGPKGGRPRPPVPYTVDKAGKDFAKVRAAEFPGDKRQLADFRRSGSIEALAGRVDLAWLAAKMGNSIDRSKFLQATYLPQVSGVVRLVDEARKRGRGVLRGAKGE